MIEKNETFGGSWPYKANFCESAGVELDPSGLPIESDILKAAPSLVSLKFPLESI